MGGTLLTQSFSFLNDREFNSHSPYMWKSCSGPTPCGPHIDRRGVTSFQGGILADYNQIDTRVLKWNPAKFGYPKSLHIWATRDYTGNYGPLILYVEIVFCTNALRTPYWLTWCHGSSGRIGWLRPNWYTCPEMKSCHVWLSQVPSHLSYRWLRYSYKTPFWYYIYDGDHPIRLKVKHIQLGGRIKIIKLNTVLWVRCWKHVLDSLSYI